MLYDQILLGFANRVTIIQYLSTSIAYTIRKHRIKLTVNLSKIPQSSGYGNIDNMLILSKNQIPINDFRLIKDIMILDLRF